jgi:hypothetical protein
MRNERTEHRLRRGGGATTRTAQQRSCWNWHRLTLLRQVLLSKGCIAIVMAVVVAAATTVVAMMIAATARATRTTAASAIAAPAPTLPATVLQVCAAATLLAPATTLRMLPQRRAGVVLRAPLRMLVAEAGLSPLATAAARTAPATATVAASTATTPPVLPLLHTMSTSNWRFGITLVSGLVRSHVQL